MNSHNSIIDIFKSVLQDQEEYKIDFEAASKIAEQIYSLTKTDLYALKAINDIYVMHSNS